MASINPGPPRQTRTPSGTGTTPKRKKVSTHWLYVAVIVAVVAGAAVGLIFGKDAAGLAIIGTAFVNLIKMMIGPIIFCTIVLGIGSVRKASQVGKVGGISFIVLHTRRYSNALTPNGCAKCTCAPRSCNASTAQYQPYVASSTTSGASPARAITVDNRSTSLLIRMHSN